MSVLVRIYIPQKDKANISRDTFEEGLELLGKTEADIKQGSSGLALRMSTSITQRII